VVQNPIFDSSPESKNRACPAIPERLHVAIVGRLVEQKRPHLFLAVLSELAQHGISVRGTVIGDGPLRVATEHQASQLGLDVSFVGWQEPWWEAASDIDCVVATARVEGLNLVLVEAAARGIASVASSRALGVADALIPGVTGELAMTDRPADYAASVIRATSRPMPSDHTLSAWLEHFSTRRSTSALLAAVSAVQADTSH
jgi:glycosyltransferase involved in cell wall biosynthesis